MTAPPVVMIHSTASASTSAARSTTAAVTRAITARILNVGRGRLDVDARIRDLGEALHEAVLDHVRYAVRVAQRRVAREPDVEIEEHVVHRPARADVVAAEHLGHAHHHAPDL